MFERSTSAGPNSRLPTEWSIHVRPPGHVYRISDVAHHSRFVRLKKENARTFAFAAPRAAAAHAPYSTYDQGHHVGGLLGALTGPTPRSSCPAHSTWDRIARQSAPAAPPPRASPSHPP
eukprot:396740-Prorocentrum_minimum.AAC.1